ncbi:hypothetical protein Tco_1382044 [Tanacetum coccineum]
MLLGVNLQLVNVNAVEEQFWATAKVKIVSGEVQLQAIVDRKKIIITESTVRRDLQLEDAEGVDCLPNATIFEQLTLMSSNTTAWNEFSSTMASVIICLATNQKFHFLKYIFESMVKNLDNVGKFLMYLRFVQVFLDKQLEGMATHNGIYIAPSHTKKIFGNMRRVGKGFSGKETPLFQIMVIQDQAEVGEGSENPTDPHHIPTIIQTSTSQPQKKQKPRKPKRKDTQIPQSSGPIDNVADEAVNEEMDDSLVRAAITANSLDAEQDRGNINNTQSKATPNEVGSQRTTSSGGPSCEDSLKLEELMAICINLQQRVLDLETIKTTQANEIASLKRRVKKLKRRNKSRTYGLKRLYKVGLIARVESSEDEGLGEEDTSKQGRIFDIDADEDITLVNDQDDADMFGVNDLDGNEVIVDNVEVVKTATTISVANTILVSAATTTTTTITEVEITLAQELAKLKSAKAKADKVVIQEPEQVTTTTTLTTTIAATTITAASTRPKAKGIVIQEQDQAPTPTAKINVDYELAQRLQAQEQEELTDEEKARLFVQFLEQRRKYFAAKRAEEKRNRPPTRAQQRSIMCTYLKNMKGWKPKNLKNKSFANIQEFFEKAMKRVNIFVDYKTELVEESSKKAETELAEAEIAQESSSKRSGEELEQESLKKQKVEEDKESEELKQCLEIVPDDGDDVTIDATPLSIKAPTIVDYKIYQEGKKSFF